VVHCELCLSQRSANFFCDSFIQVQVKMLTCVWCRYLDVKCSTLILTWQ
jgi:hypothetical protein